MPVTIKDIAKVANVSHTTVSRALNDNPVISAPTTQRIKRIAREMGYTRSAVAVSLRSKHTRTIGMVVSSLDDPFFGRVVGGVEQVAQVENYSVFLSTSRNTPDQGIAAVESLYRRRVDAIIITSLWLDSVSYKEFDRFEVPIVIINNQTEGKFVHSVSVDDALGSQLAVEHLLNLGHQRIGFVGTTNNPRSNRERSEGYRLAHQKAGVPVASNRMIQPAAEGYFERGKMALGLLLEADATAAFCYNDLTAIGLMTACREQGICVPEDFSIVGYDDLELSDYVTPGLTTIHQPRATLGELAMRMALDLLNEKEVQDQVLPCELVVRASTALPGGT